MFFSAKTGKNLIRGTYVTGTLEGYGNYKQVYARAGKEGSYSGTKGLKDKSVSHTDYGSMYADYFEARPIWW